MQAYFNALADHLGTRLRGAEIYTASLQAEVSDFVRFNKAAVRQAGTVRQLVLSVDLIDGARHSGADLTLTGDFALDARRLDDALDTLRARLPLLPEDPHLVYATEVCSTERASASTLPSGQDAVDAILYAARGLDFVGFHAQGPVYTGFANSFGQRNWFAAHSFNLSWSLYRDGDKAVKSSYAGFTWDPREPTEKMRLAASQLEVLGRAPKTIAPGRYRAYLAPAAMQEVTELLCWGGFGLEEHRTKQTPLIRLAGGEASLHPAITLRENTRDGTAPDFQASGFVRPEAVTLIGDGAWGECLVSPRSAKEYAVPTNGASAAESPESLDLAAGDLPRAEVLRRLGTGLYVNNLWYLNYSDRAACRMTGMTRFATFWVEDGEIVAPLNVMRFDESLYRLWGTNLVGLTAERDFILDSDTYFKRSTRSVRLPGAVVDEMAFTL